MIITGSNVSMASANNYNQYKFVRTSVSGRVSGDSQKENNLGFYQNLLKSLGQIFASQNKTNSLSTQISIRLQLLHKIFAAILGNSELDGGSYYSLTARNAMSGGYDLSSYGIEGSLWEQTTETCAEYRELESTSFSSRGVAQTADGRTIDFGVNLTMSRSFTSVFSSYTTRKYFVTDPLVINLDSNATDISDVKFFFDLDCDGTKEEISQTGTGSGFLAWDKNGDGIINDGSELFGTQSGDGFADLAEEDADGNGWIDEADEIFSKLRVWTRDEDGTDHLIDLKEAGIGAIYLGSAETDYTFTDNTNYANGYLKSTGIYLREDGTCGTLGQVDLTTGAESA